MVEALRTEYSVRENQWDFSRNEPYIARVTLTGASAIYLPTHRIFVVGRSFTDDASYTQDRHEVFLGNEAEEKHSSLIERLASDSEFPGEQKIEVGGGFIYWAHSLHYAQHPTDKIRDLFRRTPLVSAAIPYR